MRGIEKYLGIGRRWGSVLPLCLMACLMPSVVLSQQGGPALGEITYLDGHIEVFMQDAQEVAAQAANGHIFQTRPAIRTSTKHFGERITRQTWMCIRFDTGQIVPNSDITMMLSQEPNSGGHDHDDAGRDDHLGEYTPDSFNTGSTGISDPIEYKADEVSGVVNLRVDCTFPPGSGVFPGFSLFTIGVEFPNLVEIPADPAYNLIGATS